MYFVDFGELMDLNAMWLQGFWMASQTDIHKGETDPEVMEKVVNLLASARAMKADGYANHGHVENWLLDLASIATYLWD